MEISSMSVKQPKNTHFGSFILTMLPFSFVNGILRLRGSAFMAVDTVLHGLSEQNPPEAAKKITRCSLPKTTEENFKHQQGAQL
jgi:hypothetical protein